MTTDLDGEHDDEIVDERSWTDLLGGKLEPGDILAEKYRVDSLVGYGAMGFVVKAWHLQLEEPVAVKFLLPELAASEEALVRFEREARAAFKIKSEHIARVLDVGRVEGGQPFLVMEFLTGIELGELVYEQQMEIGLIVDYLLQACDAIAEAHALGIVHRDLKPDNLFLAERRDGTHRVKVLDFGLSKLVPRAGAKRERAVTGEAQVMGTAHYMSPEQWVAAKDVGPAADIWALGVILYEALTGESPFIRNNLAAMCNAVLREEPTPIHELRPDVPPEIEAIVARCLKKEQSERYPTVQALAADLVPFAKEQAAIPRAMASLSASSPAPSSAGPFSLPRAVPSQSELEVVPSSLRGKVNLRPAGAPALGLLNPDGTVDTWADILAEATPPASHKKILIVLAVALVVIALFATLAV